MTTNPFPISHENGDFKSLISEILSIIDGPVSVEVISSDADGMVKEVKVFATWSRNVVIEIHMIPEGLKTMKSLKALDIKPNIPLVFSAN